MDTGFWGWVLFSFNGRITRKYYWLTFLFFVVIELLFFGLGSITFGFGFDPNQGFSAMSGIGMLCALPLMILVIWVGLAVSVKRWHDRAKSGWWVLIGLVPIIGFFWVLIECGFLAGTDGVNQYGVANTPPADPLSGSGTTSASAPPPPASVDPVSTPAPEADADAPDNAGVPENKDDNPYST